jgi:hypothetical protein
VRLWWDDSPVDLFFSNHEFHDAARARSRMVPLGGTEIPVLACNDLAVFKAFFSRGQDLVDIEAMAEAGSLHVGDLLDTVAVLLGRTHPNWHALARALDVEA